MQYSWITPELNTLFYGKVGRSGERNLRKANVKFLRIRKSLLVNTRFIKGILRTGLFWIMDGK